MLWELFITFFKIGGVSIGGGYAILPLIQSIMVNEFHWLTQQDFLNLITLSQMTPGPIAINSSTFVGMRVAGVPGAIVATIGCAIVGISICVCLYLFFQKHKDNHTISYVLLGLRAVSTGLIGVACMSIFMSALENVTNAPIVVSGINIAAIIIFAIGFYLMRYKKMNPILMLVISGIIGLFVYL